MEGSLEDLAKYRYSLALEDLESAKNLLKEDDLRLALNRSYYSIFHAMRAVNTLDEFDSSRHSSVIAHFNKEHVKNGDFPKEIAKMITGAMEIRQKADYEDFYIASRKDAENQVKSAENFAELVKQYLVSKNISLE